MACELVICGADSDPSASAEFAEGLARLKHQTCSLASWHFVSSGSGLSLLEAALAAGHGRPDSDRVLLLAHAKLLMADGTLALLASALEEGMVIALCFGAGHIPAHCPPDYCTVRGLERYVHAMAHFVTGEPVVISKFSGVATADCLASMARLGTLRAVAQGMPVQGRWQPGCFAHDYSTYHQGFQGRNEMVDWVPMAAHRVLDVGGGEGHFLELLRAERGCQTHLSEFSEAVCTLARPRVDFLWSGDFMALDADAVRARVGLDGRLGVFDCITFLDSLEHAAEPGQWLGKAHALLRGDGCIVGSIPNVGHWSVVADLLEGRWDYCPVGIHCSTHLRFFTRRTITYLLERHGFALEAMGATLVPAPDRWARHWLTTPGLQTVGAELDAYAFLFRARKICKA